MLRDNAKKAAGEQSSAMSPTLAWPWVRAIFLEAEVVEHPRMRQAPVPRTCGISLRCASIYCSACAKSPLRRKLKRHQAIANCCAATSFSDCSIGGTPRAEPMHRAWHSGRGRARPRPRVPGTRWRDVAWADFETASEGDVASRADGAPARRASPGFRKHVRERRSGIARGECRPWPQSTSNDCSSTGSVTLIVPDMPAPGAPWISQ